MRSLVEELIAAWEAGDAHRAAAFFGDDATYQEPGRAPIVGREAILEHFQRFFRDGPAWRIHVGEIVAEGERAAVEYRFEIAADGAWRTRTGCAIVRREGASVALWHEYRGE
jgi:uncharacterized protein (TIGR02246 family)